MRYIIPVAIIAVLLFYFFIPASKDKDASAEIGILLTNLIESANKEDIDVVMEYFSPEYIDSEGRTYPVIKQIIENAFDRFGVIESGYSDLVVATTENEDGDTVTTANLDIWVKVVRSGTSYKLIGSEDTPHNIDIVFQSVMFGGWKILSVEGVN